MARREQWREQAKLARLLDKWLEPDRTFWTTTDPVAPSVTSGAVREALLRAGAQWWVCRSANAAMCTLYESGAPFRMIVHEGGTIECWQPPELPAWEVPKRDPHERRPRAPDYWEPEEAAEIAELAAASDDAANGDIAA